MEQRLVQRVPQACVQDYPHPCRHGQIAAVAKAAMRGEGDGLRRSGQCGSAMVAMNPPLRTIRAACAAGNRSRGHGRAVFAIDGQACPAREAASGSSMSREHPSQRSRLAPRRQVKHGLLHPAEAARSRSQPMQGWMIGGIQVSCGCYICAGNAEIV